MADILRAGSKSGDSGVPAEIPPPVSTDPAEFLSRAMPLKGLVTAVNRTDGAGAKVHLSSPAAAHLLVHNGIQAIFPMAPRDRHPLPPHGDNLRAAAPGRSNNVWV